jgi:hypothetical protein
VGGLEFVLELLLPLQRLDKSFLGEILGVVDVADHVVNLAKNAAQIIRYEALLKLGRSRAFLQQRSALPVVFRWDRVGLFHANLKR